MSNKLKRSTSLKRSCPTLKKANINSLHTGENYLIIKDDDPFMKMFCDEDENDYTSQFEKYIGKEDDKYIFQNKSNHEKKYKHDYLKDRIYISPFSKRVDSIINKYFGGNKRRKSKKKFLFRKSKKTRRIYKKGIKNNQ